jgi:aspartate kinase
VRGGMFAEPRVLKFGGSSLTSPAHIRNAAGVVAAAVSGGRPAVVVVSARGATTDRLLDEARAMGGAPDTRELDQLLVTGEIASAALLAMALHELGHAAISLSGEQAGVVVRGPHGAGRIDAVRGKRIGDALRAGQIVVVAGFHGVNEAGDIVTLGRGGSDTSAVALAASLGIRSCEIYTDVDGVFTADPRVVPSARLIPVVGAAAMAEMAFAGARVLHSRSVQLANSRGVDIHVRNSLRNGSGTVVRATRNGGHMLEREQLIGIAHAVGIARVVVHGPADGGIAFLTELAAGAIPVDVLIRLTDGLDLTVSDEHLSAVYRIAARLGCRIDVAPSMAKVSLLGGGLLDRPEYPARLLACLDRAGIRVHSVVTSQLRCTVTVESKHAHDAVRLLHAEFDLDRDLSTVGDGESTRIGA